jgi:hypothetical protein
MASRDDRNARVGQLLPKCRDFLDAILISVKKVQLKFAIETFKDALYWERY